MAGTLEFSVVLIALLLMTLLATIQTHLEIAEDLRAGTLSIARFLIFSLAAGFLVFTPKDQLIATSVAVVLPLVWLVQQAVGRKLGRLGFARKLAERLDSFVTVLSRLFQPLRLRAPEKVEEYEQELIESVEEFSETLVREIIMYLLPTPAANDGPNTEPKNVNPSLGGDAVPSILCHPLPLLSSPKIVL